MTNQQYRRANAVAFNVCVVILIGMILLMVGSGFQLGFSSAIIIQIIVTIIGFLIDLLGFLKHREEKSGGVLIMLGSTIAYFSLVVTQSNLIFFAFGLPVLFSSIVYLNLRLIFAGEGAIFLGFLIGTVRTIATSGNINNIIVAAITLALSFVAASMTVRMLVAFTTENTAEIEKLLVATQKNDERMQEIAGNVSGLLDDARSNIGAMAGLMEDNRAGINNISEGMESSAQEITNQAQKSQEIHDLADEARGYVNDVTESSKTARENVDQGVHVVEELREKAKVLENNGKVTVESTREVIDKIAGVQEFIDSITAISRKTTMLALNASIEAARAGEAGKGFAVVANNIRQLSEQTDRATAEIINIINELTNEARRAMESVDETVVSVNEQTELIAAVEENFNSINESVTDMVDKFAEVGNSMHTIADYTADMSENITTLSSTSEEVAAVSREGAEQSSQVADRFEHFRGTIQSIYDEANKLNEV